MGVPYPKLITCSTGKLEGMIGVQTGPGETPFTRIPSLIKSSASDRVNVIMAPFDVEKYM